MSPYGAGLGLIKGDPHVRVKLPNQGAICYDVDGAELNYVSLIHEPSTGLEINGQIEHVRGARTTKNRLSAVGLRVCTLI